jgi:hypothetical protein
VLPYRSFRMELDSICRWAKGQEAKNPGHAPRCGGGWDRDPRAGPEARVARTPQPQNARLVPGHLGVGLTARLVWKDVVRVSAICRTARTHHREFAMGTGEMSSEALTAFLQTTLGHAAAFCRDGAIAFVCMDWRHMGELLAAGRAIFSELKNLCIWNKTNGGMGSFYRSMHELVFAFKIGRAPHTNSFGLGETGRYRTNVWDYAGINAWRPGRAEELATHPTVKPVALVADAIKDCSRCGEIVLDLFGGSGSTLIAAERTGRQARLVEFDPAYCDQIVRRFEQGTGKQARLAAAGQNFEEVAAAKEDPQ